jgi:hypothetical protein
MRPFAGDLGKDSHFPKILIDVSKQALDWLKYFSKLALCGSTSFLCFFTKNF